MKEPLHGISMITIEQLEMHKHLVLGKYKVMEMKKITYELDFMHTHVQVIYKFYNQLDFKPKKGKNPQFILHCMVLFTPFYFFKHFQALSISRILLK